MAKPHGWVEWVASEAPRACMSAHWLILATSQQEKQAALVINVCEEVNLL